MFFKKTHIVALALLSLVIATSCSPYQKVLKSDDAALKFATADSLYQEGKYKKALKLMEDIVPAYRGKPQAERLMFFYADTYFQLEDYYLSGYQFERFARSYPSSDKIIEASFKGAKSYYELSPRFSLDQKETYTGLEKLQSFIDRYPDSDYIAEANTLVDELNLKLERKAIEISKQYYNRDDFKAAIAAFDNFITDFPGSSYRAEAFYMRMLSSYRLADNSFDSLVQERMEEAKEHYQSFNKYFSDSEFKADADEILAEIEDRLIKIQS
ncbi:MAG: outer membrane protein assembly factor BamD [Gilvibacter sp.]